MAVDFWILSVMAEQGDAAAQYCFGLLYQRGGVMYKGTKAIPQDMAEGLMRVRKAADAQSNTNAKTFTKLTGELIQN